MNERSIRLETRQHVEEFVEAAAQCEFNIDVGYDKVLIDAKSFLGMLGLGYSRILNVKYCGENKEFEQVLQKYAVG